MKQYLTPVVESICTDGDLCTDLLRASKESEEFGVMNLEYDIFQ